MACKVDADAGPMTIVDVDRDQEGLEEEDVVARCTASPAPHPRVVVEILGTCLWDRVLDL